MLLWRDSGTLPASLPCTPGLGTCPIDKVALSVGPWLALTLLALVGFEPGVGSGTAEGLLGLKLLFVLGPATGFVVAALIAWNHPLDQVRHAELRRQIEADRTGA